MPTQPARASRPGRRLLIVDDNQDAAEMLSISLDMLGYHTAIAHDAHRAIAIAEEWHPDAAILDIGLPEINGYELAERLLSRVGPAKMVLIALTGYTQPSDRAKALESGFSEHLGKPIDMRRLFSMLERVLPAT